MSCLPLKGWDFTPHAQALNKQRCFYIAHQNIVAIDQRIRESGRDFPTTKKSKNLHTLLDKPQITAGDP